MWATGRSPSPKEGPLLAMTVVLAPDAPALQVAGCQTILIVFSAAQAYHWPWKAPILNVVDFIVCFLLSIFVLTASFYVPAVTGPVFETFQALSLAILVCLIGVVLVLMLCAIFALLYRVASGSEMELAIMTVGRTPSPGIVSKALCTVNVALRASEPNVVDQRVAELGVYDHQMLLRSITILNSEVSKLNLLTSVTPLVADFGGEHHDVRGSLSVAFECMRDLSEIATVLKMTEPFHVQSLHVLVVSVSPLLFEHTGKRLRLQKSQSPWQKHHVVI